MNDKHIPAQAISGQGHRLLRDNPLATAQAETIPPLYTAAPDMLEALREARSEIKALEADYELSLSGAFVPARIHAPEQDPVIMIERAIKKATGETK